MDVLGIIIGIIIGFCIDKFIFEPIERKRIRKELIEEGKVPTEELI